MASKAIREKKVQKIADLAEQLEVNGVAIAEVGFNWSTVPSSKNLALWIKVDRDTRSVAAHNIHGPRASKGQQGITVMLLLHTVIF